MAATLSWNAFECSAYFLEEAINSAHRKLACIQNK